MSMKVFLVEMKFTIPVVAEDEETAIRLVSEDNQQMATLSFEQMRDQLAEGDDEDIEFACREVTAESLESTDEEWLNAVPYGEEEESTIAERLIFNEDDDEEGQWSEPNHPED